MIIQSTIDQRDSMYPTINYMLDPDSDTKLPIDTQWASIYGYSFGDNTVHHNDKTYQLSAGQYFSIWLKDYTPTFHLNSKLFIVVRLGYKCQTTMGWVEKQGRLSYIDGCTDSLLIYPPRQGDPSLNLLNFPHGITQTRHLHPSIRMGCVISGEGWSDVWDNGTIVSNQLSVGTNFCLEENELHRFRTDNSSMTVIAWHPDGDWGPTDHNHTMLNRTYIKHES